MGIGIKKAEIGFDNVFRKDMIHRMVQYIHWG